MNFSKMSYSIAIKNPNNENYHKEIIYHVGRRSIFLGNQNNEI